MGEVLVLNKKNHETLLSKGFSLIEETKKILGSTIVSEFEERHDLIQVGFVILRNKITISRLEECGYKGLDHYELKNVSNFNESKNLLGEKAFIYIISNGIISYSVTKVFIPGIVKYRLVRKN